MVEHNPLPDLEAIKAANAKRARLSNADKTALKNKIVEDFRVEEQMRSKREREKIRKADRKYWRKEWWSKTDHRVFPAVNAMYFLQFLLLIGLGLISSMYYSGTTENIEIISTIWFKLIVGVLGFAAGASTMFKLHDKDMLTQFAWPIGGISVIMFIGMITTSLFASLPPAVFVALICWGVGLYCVRVLLAMINYKRIENQSTYGVLQKTMLRMEYSDPDALQDALHSPEFRAEQARERRDVIKRDDRRFFWTLGLLPVEREIGLSWKHRVARILLSSKEYEARRDARTHDHENVKNKRSFG